MDVKREKGSSDRKTSGLSGGMRGDSETQRVLNLWKGRRFLKRLRRFCSEKEADRAVEGTRR
jgi:hypothetical protein